MEEPKVVQTVPNFVIRMMQTFIIWACGTCAVALTIGLIIMGFWAFNYDDPVKHTPSEVMEPWILWLTVGLVGIGATFLRLGRNGNYDWRDLQHLAGRYLALGVVGYFVMPLLMSVILTGWFGAIGGAILLILFLVFLVFLFN